MFILMFVAVFTIIQPTPERKSPEELLKVARNGNDILPVGAVITGSNYKGGFLNWKELGPKPIQGEYWSGNANASGRVCDILIDPNHPNVAYIAGAQGGVWKTIDGGVTWQPLTDALSSLASGDLCFDPFNTNIIYYGTGEQHFSGDSYYGDGLFKTTNGGSTWVKIASTSSVGSYIARVIVSPDNSNIIYVASDIGFNRSTDGGATWTTTLSYSWCTDMVVRTDSANIVLAAIYGYGIYKSTNYGATWTHITSGLPSSGFNRINMAISRSNPNIIYASFVNASTSGLLGLYRTSDGGNNWSQVSGVPDYLYAQGWYDNCIIIDPTNPAVIYAGGVFPYSSSYHGLIMTRDAWVTWSDITIANDGTQLHPDMHCLAISNDGYLWVGNDGGVWKTSNPGTTWVNLNQNLGLTQFYSLDFHPSDTIFIIGGTQDNGAVHMTLSGWIQDNPGDGGPVAIEVQNPDIYYTSYVHIDPLYKWSKSSGYLGNVTGGWTGDRASWCSGPVTSDPTQPGVIYVGTYRVWKTVDGGTNWVIISGDLTGGGGHLRTIAVSSNNSNVIYTGSSDGYIYYTSDGGTTWHNRSVPSIPYAFPSIVIDPSNDAIVYTCTERNSSSRVFYSTDAGVSWNDITGTLPGGVKPLSMTADFSGGTPVLYLGTDYGVYASTDLGTTWTKQDNGLPNAAVFSIKTQPGSNFIVAATHGRGMWKSSIATGITDHASQLPMVLRSEISGRKIKLVFNRSRMPEKIILMDLAGRILVKNAPVSGEMEINEIRSSGIYFIKSIRETESETLKLIIM